MFNRDAKGSISTFVNLSVIDAKYNSDVKSYYGKFVEFVPRLILRTGVSYRWKKFTSTLQYSYTDDQFSDATNAPSSSSGIYGIVPAYAVLDFSASYGWKYLTVRGGINNLLNEKYFTRRADGYPGPGILPADPINFYATIQIKF